MSSQTQLDSADHHQLPAIQDSLLQIWRSCFGSDQIGSNDDFFDLGGDSLKAISLVRSCNDRFGTRLQTSALFEYPTIAELAFAISSSGDNRADRRIVRMRDGTGRVPLVLIHPVGGTVFCYDELTARLPEHLPIFGFQAAGLKAGEPLATSVQEMAAKYLKEARSVIQSRTWHLAGWSFGGLVAFEMARRLAEDGDIHASATLIDTPLPDAPLASDDEIVVIAIAGALRLDLATLSPSGEIPPIETLISTVRSGSTAMREDDLHRLIVLVRNILELRRAFRPQRTRAPVTVIRAISEALMHPEYYDWGKYVKSEVRFFDLPTTHHSMIVPPHVGGAARILSEIIERP
jgi:thioesterase domain-containing protein/acyl carrier protein